MAIMIVIGVVISEMLLCR